jgi:hypothetical protein
MRPKSRDVSKFVDLVGIGDDMAHRPPADAVGDVFGPQCGGGRHDDRPQLHDRQHRFPQLDLIAQHDHDAIAGRDAAGDQRRGEPIGAGGQLGEGVGAIAPVRPDDAQRRSRVAGRDGVEPVERPVEPVADGGQRKLATAAS